MIVAETDRLILRHFESGDAPFVLELLTDPDFRANIGDRGVHDLATAREWVEVRAPAVHAEHGYGMFAVVARDSGRAVGMAGLVRRDGLDHPDIGYAFLPAGRGRGYALEAVRTVLDWATGRGIETVVAIVSPGNMRSIAILERVGMMPARTTRMPGADHDVILYVPARDGANTPPC